MRIAHVCHGQIEIPPRGYGAVESLVWDYKFYCEQFGHEFRIVNNAGPGAADEIAAFAPDVLHLHDERRISLLLNSSARVKIVTSHDPQLFPKPDAHFLKFDGDFIIGCLCPDHVAGFRNRGVSRNRLWLLPNGARSDLIRFSPLPISPKAVCLAKWSARKRQTALAHIPAVEFATDWNKAEVHENLTSFTASILVSEREAAPLAVVESLMAGLPVIVSEAAAANLHDGLPFVLRLPEIHVRNPFYLRAVVDDFLRKAPRLRYQARQYAVEHFAWSKLVADYCRRLSSLLK